MIVKDMAAMKAARDLLGYLGRAQEIELNPFMFAEVQEYISRHYAPLLAAAKRVQDCSTDPVAQAGIRSALEAMEKSA